jgi:hypothetical protein
MRKLLTYAIPVILGVGLLAALVNNPSEDGQLSASRQPGSVTEDPFGLPAVIEEPTTSTTTAPVAVEVTTTTTAYVTPTTAARPVYTPKPAAPKPAPKPAPTPQPQPPAYDCGTGSAQAKVTLIDVDPGIGTMYRLVATATSSASKTVELDKLVVQAMYGGVNKTFTANVAGRKIEPGTSISIEIPESDSASAPSNSPQITEFVFHTAGLPQCSSQ